MAALRYSGPLARTLVLWKYRDQRYLSPILAELLLRAVSTGAPEWWETIEAIVPAPLHPRALRARGFSPPEELAATLAHSFAKPYLPRVLFKVRHTPPQARLSSEARMLNLTDSMKVFDSTLVEGRVIAVVDDVMTTGATMNECARALMDAGAAKVYGVVLARQADHTPVRRPVSISV